MLTPGEISTNMFFTVLEGKPAAEQEDIWKESQPESFSFGFTWGNQVEKDPVFGIAHCYKVAAINLPFVIAVDVVTQKGAIFDCRNVILKEVDKKFVEIFVKTFKTKKKNKNNSEQSA